MKYTEELRQKREELREFISRNKDIIREEVEIEIRELIKTIPNAEFFSGLGAAHIEIKYKGKNNECYLVEIDCDKPVFTHLPDTHKKHKKTLEKIISLYDFLEKENIYLNVNTTEDASYKYFEPKFEYAVNNVGYKQMMVNFIKRTILSNIGRAIDVKDKELFYWIQQEKCHNVSNYTLWAKKIYDILVEKGVIDGSHYEEYLFKAENTEGNKKLVELANKLKISLKGAIYFVERVRQWDKKGMANFLVRGESYVTNKTDVDFEKFIMHKLNGTSIASVDEIKSFEYNVPKVIAKNKKTGVEIEIDAYKIAKDMQKNS